MHIESNVLVVGDVEILQRDGPVVVSPIQKTSLSESVVDYIKQQTIAGYLNPGERIVETKIAEVLGISQTPVREALRQLSGEGIVALLPNRGAIIRPLEVSDVFEIYSIRAVLEGMAMRFACQGASHAEVQRLQVFFERMIQKVKDPGFSAADLVRDSAQIHQYIVDLARHSRLETMYSSLAFQIGMVNRVLGSKSTKQLEVDRHRELVDAMTGRDPNLAERVMRQHIYRSYTEYLEVAQGTRATYRDYTWC